MSDFVKAILTNDSECYLNTESICFFYWSPSGGCTYVQTDNGAAQLRANPDEFAGLLPDAAMYFSIPDGEYQAYFRVSILNRIVGSNDNRYSCLHLRLTGAKMPGTMNTFSASLPPSKVMERVQEAVSNRKRMHMG